jgi:hypothetical protein
MRKLTLLIAFLFIGFGIQAQELKCQIQVISRQIQKSDRSIFEEMQRTMFEFMNNTVFTKHVVKTQERIECSIVITLNEQSGSDTYKGTIQISSTRPVFNSDYNTPIINMVDDKFQFRFAPQDAIEFNVNSYSSTLSSVLTYYAYLILAFDYDSFGSMAGTQFLTEAEKLVSNAQSDPSPGWRSFQDDGKNRAAIVEDLQNDLYSPLRQCYYEYHRQGLDLMTDKKDQARSNIFSALEKLRGLYRKRPDSYLLQLFFETKVDEIVNIFKESPAQEKRLAFNLLSQIDPGRQDKYRTIMQTD